MFCIKCGAQIPEDSLFCNKCGQAVGGDIAPKTDEEIIKHEALVLAQRATIHYGQTKNERIVVVEVDPYGRSLVEVSFTAFGIVGVPGTYIYYAVVQGVNAQCAAILGPNPLVRVYHRDYLKAKEQAKVMNNWNVPR